jgi:hypothetical protein
MSGDGDGVFIEDKEDDVVEYRDTRTAPDDVFDEKNEPDQSFFLNPAVSPGSTSGSPWVDGGRKYPAGK